MWQRGWLNCCGMSTDSSSSQKIEPQALAIEVEGNRLAAELWGQSDQPPVIALHGWLDNCHSFRPLGPHLNNLQLLALDMAGHGHSDHRSPDASYHIWDDVKEILLLADAMNWPRFSLLGHSRGAIVASLVAAVAPDRIEKLALLEGLWPLTAQEDQAAEQFSSYIQTFMQRRGREPSLASSIDTMIKTRLRGGFGVKEDTARLLVERNSREVTGGLRWRTDDRLLMPSPMMLTPVQASSFIDRLECPVRLYMGDEAMGHRIENIKQRLQEVSPDIETELFSGGHHFHMEGDLAALARSLCSFLGCP